MPHVRAQEIEFVGGPLDGHSERFPQPLHSPVLVKTLAVRRHWLIQWVQSVFLGKYNGAFLVAVYELQLCDEQLRYHYLATNVASEIREDSGCAWIVLSDCFQLADKESLEHGADLDR